MRKVIRKKSLKKEIVQGGDNVYKLSTSEKWSLVVPITEEEATQYQQEEKKYMQVELTRDHTIGLGLLSP